MKFPYQQYQTAPSPTVPSGILHRPEIPLRIIGSSGDISLLALLDTGSDDTLFPLSAGKMIGAKMDSNQSWKAEGIGGQTVDIILGQVELELKDTNQTFHWIANVGFVDFPNPQDEVAIIGHAGFLDYFRVICNGHLQEVEIEITLSFPGQVI